MLHRLPLALIQFWCIIYIIGLSGCKEPTSPQNGGFNVAAAQRYQNANGVMSPPVPIPFVPVAGIWVRPDPNSLPQGSEQTYGRNWAGFPNSFDDELTGINVSELENTTGYFVKNGMAPGFWNHRFTFNFYCGTDNGIGTGTILGDNGWPITTYTYANNNEYTFLQAGVEDTCYYYYNGQRGIPPASTRFAITGQQPQTLTLTGQSPIMTQFGLPLLYIYDNHQNLVNTITATNVSADRTQATFPFPSSLSSSAYSLAIVNQTNTGPGFSTAGTNLLSIASSQTIPGNPFGVAVNALTDAWEDRDGCEKQTWTSSTYNTSPVVTLYSTNQVRVGGNYIGVGANPTAVVTYTGPSERVASREGCDAISDTYTGTTRAIVANSGANTVSLLDTVYNSVLNTITVGNQPVALAVTSDGSTAYVANYTDGTVTQVNLNTATPTATVAVGGNPTSVALTSAGVLWVGGVGFLAEVNTQTMGVVATQSTGEKTLSALAYSNSVGELIATSTDSSGNVNVEEVNPVTVKTGALYAAVSSHTVSSLGTYYRPLAQAQVQGFTATLGTSSIPINSNLPGTPPLVVQDGWAVVSATPTGFTITDITGHIVLVNETTPSPVAAISVDANLNVAYLTMPDSNTLLTVPLPGTGSN